jgi:signal transduction histidine kinase
MKRPFTKLGLLLALAFLVLNGALLLAVPALYGGEHVIALASWTVLAGITFALLAALVVFVLFTRRLKRLADSVQGLAEGGFTSPLRVPGADPHGDEIDRLASHIERMSERITEQLAEIERAASRRRELLVNVSHDLRTPLTSLQGYLEMLMLRRGSLSAAEEHSYLETAVRHSERLSRLVTDLFEFTNLGAQETVVQAEDFSLAELAQDVAQKFALDATRRRIDLRAECGACTGEGEGEGAARARADIGMIERVLENLLDNALRHTPEGGRVTIEASCSTGRARLAVRDSGVGITPCELDMLFERYDRTDRTEPGGGRSGLGLAIAQRIVQLHGGELLVQSGVGSGTCVSFDLPLARSLPTLPGKIERIHR